MLNLATVKSDASDSLSCANRFWKLPYMRFQLTRFIDNWAHDRGNSILDIRLALLIVYSKLFGHTTECWPLKTWTPMHKTYSGIRLMQAKAYYTVEDHSGNNRKANGSQWVRISNGFFRRVRGFRIQPLALHLWKRTFQVGKGSIIWKR